MTKDRAMKPLTFLYMLAATAILFLSCGNRGRYAEALLSAEQTVKSSPYDAIVALEGRKDSLCHSEADSALYELVYAEALRGHGLQMSDTTYISRSTDFFRRQGDDDRAARALLQTALCLFDGGKYVEAATKMKESEAVAIDLDDQDLHNRLFLSLARINDLVGNYSLSDFYYKLAQTAAQHINEPNRMATTLNAMAEHYLQQDNFDDFRACMNLCEPLFDSISDINRTAIEANLGCYYLAKGDTALAKGIFSRSQLMCPDRKSSLYLADIYAKEGDKKMATALWYDATNSPDVHIRKTALIRLIALAKARGNVGEAFYLSNQLNNTYEKDISKATATAIVAMQNNFDSRQTGRSSTATMLLLIAVTIVIVGAVLALFVLFMRRRAKQKEVSLSQWNLENRLLTADCVHQLHRLAATGKTASKADMDALHELVSQYDKPLVAVLSSNKNLSPAEIDLAMLTRLRFQPSEIATLTCSSSQNVTNTRARLLRKMFGKEGGAKDFDRVIREL